MTIVNVVDTPCGYGKTSWAIKYMNEMSTDTHKFIYVTPFLSEINRVQVAVHARKFYDPCSDKGITKLEDLNRLLSEGRDIATTHALFQMADAETRKLIQSNNYTLVLDEVMNVIEQVPLKQNDLDLLFDAGAIDIATDEKGLKYITWLENKIEYDTRFNEIKHMALTGNLMYCENKALIWNLPCDLFKMFNNVFILTYLFKGQLQRYYYDLHGIRYRYLSVTKNDNEYDLVPYADKVLHDKSAIEHLITIYDGKLNNIGDNRNTLSSSWFEKNKNLVETLKNNAYNFFTNLCKANNNTALWTTVKGNKDRNMKRVKPRGFEKSFISMTTRATNEYNDRNHLAYLVNRFMNPIEKKFFEQYGVSVDEETWALSELVQWVWRSRIRNGEPIELYIPSNRMRGLLEKYLCSDFFETPSKNAIVDEPPSDWHV